MLSDIEAYVTLVDNVHFKHLPIKEVLSIALSNERSVEHKFSLFLE